jgi:opacity protein-like surface antigen
LFKRILVLIGLAGTTSMMFGQARPTASRTADLQIGGGFVIAKSDYLPNTIYGGAAYFDFDVAHHLGVEGVFHFVKDGKGSQVYEKTYEIGVRYHRTYGRFSPYIKGMYGRGVFNFPAFPGFTHANLAYNLFAVGGGVDYRILPHLNARADYEYQRWLGFPENGLSPSLFTVGGAYHF